MGACFSAWSRETGACWGVWSRRLYLKTLRMSQISLFLLHISLVNLLNVSETGTRSCGVKSDVNVRFISNGKMRDVIKASAGATDLQKPDPLETWLWRCSCRLLLLKLTHYYNAFVSDRRSGVSDPAAIFRGFRMLSSGAPPTTLLQPKMRRNLLLGGAQKLKWNLLTHKRERKRGRRRLGSSDVSPCRRPQQHGEDLTAAGAAVKDGFRTKGIIHECGALTLDESLA